MSPNERDDVKTAVKEAVREELPIAIADQLEPMVRRSATVGIRHYRRMAIYGWVALAISVILLFIDLKVQANDNSRSNHKQDCILVGLLRAVERGDTNPGRTLAYHRALGILDSQGTCSQFTPSHR